MATLLSSTTAKAHTQCHPVRTTALNHPSNTYLFAESLPCGKERRGAGLQPEPATSLPEGHCCSAEVRQQAHTQNQRMIKAGGVSATGHSLHCTGGRVGRAC